MRRLSRIVLASVWAGVNFVVVLGLLLGGAGVVRDEGDWDGAAERVGRG